MKVSLVNVWKVGVGQIATVAGVHGDAGQTLTIVGDILRNSDAPYHAVGLKVNNPNRWLLYFDHL